MEKALKMTILIVRVNLPLSRSGLSRDPLFARLKREQHNSRSILLPLSPWHIALPIDPDSCEARLGRSSCAIEVLPNLLSLTHERVMSSPQVASILGILSCPHLAAMGYTPPKTTGCADWLRGLHQTKQVT